MNTLIKRETDEYKLNLSTESQYSKNVI